MNPTIKLRILLFLVGLGLVAVGVIMLNFSFNNLTSIPSSPYGSVPPETMIGQTALRGISFYVMWGSAGITIIGGICVVGSFLPMKHASEDASHLCPHGVPVDKTCLKCDL